MDTIEQQTTNNENEWSGIKVLIGAKKRFQQLFGVESFKVETTEEGALGTSGLTPLQAKQFTSVVMDFNDIINNLVETNDAALYRYGVENLSMVRN